MAKQVTRFEADDGSLHETHEGAVAADISVIMGKIGNGGTESLTPGIARKIVENRDAIIEALKSLPPSPRVESGAELEACRG